jgi:hypothetical protein
MKSFALSLGKNKLDMPNAAVFITFLGIFFASWLWSCGLGFHVSTSSTFLAGSRLLIILSGTFLGLLSFQRAAKLGEAAHTLNIARAPDVLWASWVRAVLRSQWLAWGIASACATWILVVADRTANPAGVLMCYSLIAASATAVPLAQRSLLPRIWAFAISIALTLYLFVAGPDFYAWPMHLPLFAQLALSLAWPIFALYLGRWAKHTPSRSRTFQRPRQNSLGRVIDWYRRFTPLTAASSKRKYNQFSSLWIVPFSISLEFSNFGPHHGWGGNLGILHFLVLLLIGGCVSDTLFCRDLHWRHLLAPGGIKRDRTGWHIIVSTLAVFSSALLPLFLAYALLAWLIAGISLISTMEIAVRFSNFACEAVFIVCLATAIRGTGHWVLAVCVLYLTFALGILAAVLGFHIKVSALMAPWIQAGPTYIAILAAGSLAAILIANQLWTTQRLLPYISSGAVKEEPLLWSLLRRMDFFPAN